MPLGKKSMKQFCPVSLFTEKDDSLISTQLLSSIVRSFMWLVGQVDFKTKERKIVVKERRLLRQDVTLRSNANEQMLRQSFKRIVNIDPTPTFALLSVSWFVLLHLTPAAVVHAQP